MGREQDLCDHRPELPRRAVHPAGQADQIAKPRSRTDCSSPRTAGRRRGAALLDAYERVNATIPVRDHAAVHHAHQLHEPRGDREDAAGRRRGHPARLALSGRRTLRQQFGDERLRYFQPLEALFERASSSAAAPTTCRRSAPCGRSIRTTRSSACGPRSRAAAPVRAAAPPRGER